MLAMPGNHLGDYTRLLTSRDIPWVWEAMNADRVVPDHMLAEALDYCSQPGNSDRVLSWRLPPAETVDEAILEVNALGREAIDRGDPMLVGNDPRAQAYATFIAMSEALDEAWVQWQETQDEMDAKYGTPTRGMDVGAYVRAVSQEDRNRVRIITVALHIYQRGLEVAVRDCVSHGLMRYTTELHTDLVVVDPE